MARDLQLRTAKFWSKVDKAPGYGPGGTCWRWTGCRYILYHAGNVLGHGCFRFLGEQLTHRVAYRLTYGDIPEGFHIIHTCDMYDCVNPAHLRAGTHSDNMADKAKRGRVKGTRLSPDDVRAIRALEGSGKTQAEIGRLYGVRQDHICRIMQGTRRQHISDS